MKRLIIIVSIVLGLCATNALATGGWTLLVGELNIPRNGLTGEALDGYIYAICGGNASNNWGTNVVEKYNPSTDTWEYDCSTGVVAARHSLSSDVVDGCIYAIAGHYINSRSENDIFCGTCPPSSGAAVYARSGPGVAAYNGELYVFGGNHRSTILSRFDIYDPITNTWSYGGEMPAAAEPWRAVTLNCKIYLTAGGHVDPKNKKVWCYDPVADTWDTSIPLMNVARSCCELQTVNGRIYAIGGANYSDGYLSSVESWAPGEASWRMEPSLNVARYQFASAVLGTDIYVFGGSGDLGDLASTEVLRTVVLVDIDVKPQSCPNPLNVKSQGVLPVAVLGSEGFDVGMIDVASIRLADVAPIRSNYGDVAAPVMDGDECECTTEDPDIYTDLSLKFETEDIVNALGEVVDGEELVLTLTGALLDGTPIEGEDCIVIRAKSQSGRK